VEDPLFISLFAAIDAEPDDAALRAQVAQLLLERGRPAEALQHAAVALQHEPGNALALTVLGDASAALRPPTTTPGAAQPAGPQPAAPEAPKRDFDWTAAERDLGGRSTPPPFVDGPEPMPISPGADDGPTEAEADVERPTVTLADVGGLEDVKQRLRESFLEPMQHPEVAAAFGKSLRGGLLLYGPPGCGKTFIARAVAGELGARFMTVSLSDVLGPYLGETEQKVHAVFAKARSLAPAVLFLDEIDAIGARRSGIGSGWSGLRGMVNTLLLEMDSMSADNDGLFVLAATNAPWDVDPALLRPGRFDRMTLVLPPDAPAREAILRHHFARRPIAGIELSTVVAATEDFSGADLEHVVTSASEQAMARSVRAGRIEPVSMDDVRHVLRSIKPSTGSWLISAKNVAAFANADGRYDDLVAYLKRKRAL
jgi:AAA+ superfamily predicted ATPase